MAQPQPLAQPLAQELPLPNGRVLILLATFPLVWLPRLSLF